MSEKIDSKQLRESLRERVYFLGLKADDNINHVIEAMDAIRKECESLLGKEYENRSFTWFSMKKLTKYRNQLLKMRIFDIRERYDQASLSDAIKTWDRERNVGCGNRRLHKVIKKRKLTR